MGLMKQKVLGAFGEISGRVKKVFGAASHDRSLELEGEGQETIGRVRRKGADAIDDAIDKVGGTVGKAQQKLADLTDDKKYEAEGAARKTNGHVRTQYNR